MTFKAILTLSATFAASAALFPYTATAQDSENVQTQKVSYQPISEASIEAEIERSVMKGEHDAMLNKTYGDGVAQAFRAAYAINVMSPLWSENSADQLLKAVSIMEEQGTIDPVVELEAGKALKDRFEGKTALQRAQGDMALSMTYIHLEDVRNSPETQTSEMATPRLAGLDTQLFKTAQSGREGDTSEFNSF